MLVAKLAAGEPLTPAEQAYITEWEDLRSGFQASPKEVEREIKASRSGYFDIIRFRAPQALMMHTKVLVFWALWRVSGLMLLGMALMKLGVFTAQLSNRFYVVLTVLGFDLGLPLA